MNRREFIKLCAVSLGAIALLTGCTPQVIEIKEGKHEKK